MRVSESERVNERVGESVRKSEPRQTGRLKATNRSAQDIRSDSRRRVKAEISATPEVARTCRQERPIEDIGSTGRVNESSRLSVAKLRRCSEQGGNCVICYTGSYTDVHKRATD